MQVLLSNRAATSANVKVHRIPALPDGVRIYAVGDIHGRLDLLKVIHQAIDDDQELHGAAHCIEVYLGDYVDRGPDSCGVIDALMARRQDHDVVCLSGNHESVFVDSLSSPDIFARWLKMGGFETVLSYVRDADGGGSLARPVPSRDERALWHLWREVARPEHADFLRGLDTRYSCGGYVFVHAGLRPGIPLEAQRREDMMWIRHEFLNYQRPFDAFVVHGHTPVARPDIQSNRINIDTGAYATGHLTCLVLEGIDRYMILTDGYEA